MADSFEDRKKAFENKFKLDEEFRFKLTAKAVKLFGHWAAEHLGLKGAAASAYAEEVVDSDFDEPGIKDVLRKVQKDLKAKGIDKTEHALEKQLQAHLEEVKKP